MSGPTDEPFDALSVPEQILRLQDLRDRLAQRPDEIALTDAERAELDRRLESHTAAPDEAAPWPTVRARLRSSQ